ncbi:hypothetical protein SAMN04488041_11220 [Sulfitobacter pontiacus]|jgi:hypothetical protein|uniref:Uncharacterized protein n=1 Tax=Sulfitobacter pontiacus TaxID=60137 RepID=A0A1H3DSE7_9RHOB|nr:hypothetical protein [Sulfitobacter pontiacus]SDX69230.1 hypothetical protein SAMN04488041_11220 [Sulfitobacter pontiacus]|tara:strand:- start:5517 stop:6203 length:687 start_codon:yes stop_codon:yes gene_type:complete
MTLDQGKAKNAISSFFKTHKACMKATLAKSTGGKIYELYCLARTLEWLRSTYGVSIRLANGNVVHFKASPGNIDRFRSYFVVAKHGRFFELHTDIQVQTLGASMIGGWIGKSGYHEIDLVLINPRVQNGDMPRHSDVVLGVECKSNAKFEKGIVKQVLGIRRELSLLSQTTTSELDRAFGPPIHLGGCSLEVNADPASLYWLSYIDQSGDNYADSPGFFSIEFKHWQP